MNIFYSNVQSYNAKYDQIKLNIESLNPDVIAFCEVWQPLDTILNMEKYHPPIFKLRPKNQRGGGICLWLKKHITILKIDQLNHLKLKCIEVNSVYIQCQQKKITIVNLYRAPNKPINQSIEELEKLFNHFESKNLSTPIIYIGDTNIDLLQPEKPSTICYNNLMNQFILEQCITTPTRITHRTSTCIDHVFTNRPIDMEAHVLDISISDHQSIMVSTIEKNSTKIKTKLPEKRSISIVETINAIEENVKWPEICEKMKNLNANEGMALLIELINKNIVTKRIKHKAKNSKPWYTPKASELNAKVMIKKRQFLKSRTQANENSYKKLRNEYNKLLKKLKQEYYHNEIFLAQGNVKKTWKIINEVLNRKAKGENENEEIKLKDETDELCSDQTRVANIFNEFYINFAPELAKTIPKTDIPPEEMILNAPQPDKIFSFKDVTTNEVKEIIKSLSPKSSFGHDSISNKLVKSLINCISEPITIITNKSFKEGSFPACLKIAKLAPLFKAGNKNEVQNYRPLNQLSSLSKIIQGISLKQTKDHMKQILTKRQFGFQENHSTLHPICLTIDYIERNYKEFIALLCIDFRKAFDLINVKEILPMKLKHYNFDENSIKWITSFFTERQQYVQINNCKSEIKKTRDISVTQGSSMGPNYFNIFINDLVNNTGFECYFFADDTNCLLKNKSLSDLELSANKEFSKTQKYIEANQMSLNLEKTQYMIFKPSKHKNKNQKFELKSGSHQFKEVNEIKFLGLTIPSDLKFKTHYENVIKKMKKGIAALNLVKKILPEKTKLQIYNSLIKPHYEYCSIAWIPGLNKNQIKRIINIQKQGLRLVYSVRRYHHTAQLFIKSNVTRFDLLFKKSVIELFHKKHLGMLPKMIEEKLNEFELSKNPRTRNMKIPHFYKKGDLFYEIVNCYNNLPEKIKEPPKRLFMSKKRIKEFINNEYIICKEKNCQSCEDTIKLKTTTMG